MSTLNKPDNFAGRVNYSASIISRGKGTGRAFDNCFENYDGDAVAAALMRRAEKNERLRANLFRYIDRQIATEAYERYKGQNLAEVAKGLRTAATRKESQAKTTCTECGLPTATDDYGTCNACHEGVERKPTIRPYDNYEISPCHRYEEPDKPGIFYFEVCEPHEAHVWTLYGHLPEGGVEAIGDFATREAAEQTFQRITGVPYGSHEEVAAHLRVMHAGPKLLEVAEWSIAAIAGCEVQAKRQEDKTEFSRRRGVAFAAIAEATGRAS